MLGDDRGRIENRREEQPDLRQERQDELDIRGTARSGPRATGPRPARSGARGTIAAASTRSASPERTRTQHYHQDDGKRHSTIDGAAEHRGGGHQNARKIYLGDQRPIDDQADTTLHQRPGTHLPGHHGGKGEQRMRQTAGWHVAELPEQKLKIATVASGWTTTQAMAMAVCL